MEHEILEKFNYLRRNRKCDKCGKYFKRAHQLLPHLRRNVTNNVCGLPNNQENILVTKQIRKKSCDECGKKFGSRSNLKFHVERSVCTRKKIIYKCEKCGKTFPNEKYMNGHINRKFSCISPKKYSIASFLR